MKALLRVLAALFGLLLIAGGVYGIIYQGTGKGIDLDEEKWAINFIPGIFWVMMIFMIPVGIGIYFIIYAIRGSWPKN